MRVRVRGVRATIYAIYFYFVLHIAAKTCQIELGIDSDSASSLVKRCSTNHELPGLYTRFKPPEMGVHAVFASTGCLILPEPVRTDAWTGSCPRRTSSWPHA